MVTQMEDFIKYFIENPGIINKELYAKFPDVIPGTIRTWKRLYLMRKQREKMPILKGLRSGFYNTVEASDNG